MERTLKDFLANRKAEIKLKINALKKELADIQAAENVISVTADSESVPQKRNYGRRTIKEMVIGVLMRAPDKRGDSHEILRGLKDLYQKDIARASLSPQLSRLKDDDYLALEGSNWCLTEKALKETAPDGAASAEGDDLGSINDVMG